MRVHSTPVTIRISDPDYVRLVIRAENKGMSVRDYIRWVLFRKHDKSDDCKFYGNVFLVDEITDWKEIK